MSAKRRDSKPQTPEEPPKTGEPKTSDPSGSDTPISSATEPPNGGQDAAETPTEGPGTASAPKGHAVAKKRSIASKRGVLGPGDEVRPDDVGGAERLAELVKRGLVVKS